MHELDEIELPDGPTVDIAWLRSHLNHPLVRILDTRGRVPAPGAAAESRRADYDAGHVPGASFVEWNRDFVDLEDPVANQLAGPQRFAVAATALGIDAGTLVVAYDDDHAIFAGRLWWAFRAMGHERIRVLDGGWDGWVAAGGEITDRPTFADPAQRPFTSAPQPELRWDLARVRARSGSVTLVDARSPERFAGTGSDPVGGHIPGAVNVPYTDLVGDDGYLRPREELAAAFARVGIEVATFAGTVVTSCGSGISASVPLLALDALRDGDPNEPGQLGAVYDGSWAEWSRSGEPIATGSTDAGE